MDNTRPGCYEFRSCDLPLYYWRLRKRSRSDRNKETTMAATVRWYHYLLGLLTWPVWRKW